MHVFVVGATGFVGTHLVRRLLRDGAEVTVLVRPGADLEPLADLRPRTVEGDLFDAPALADALRARPPDVAICAAWARNGAGERHDSLTHVELVGASMKLLAVLDAVGCKRTVMLGTCIEVDTDYGYLSETTPTRPRNLYAACKHALAIMAENYQRRQGRSFAWARLFNTYGPGESEHTLVGQVVRRLANDQPCELTAGTQIRDYSHVEDVASALCAIARSDLDGVVHVGSSRPVAVADVARTIGRLMGRPELLRIGALPSRPGDWAFCCADTSKLRRVTGWAPRFGLDDGLADTIAWYERRRSETRP